jgi:(p)ppGpp synthase/HD superfamily hydrolase
MEVMAALECESDRNGNLAIQCALLHDVIEDTDITFERVDAEFGAEVAAGVLALTKNSMLDKIVQMEDSLRRIQKQPYEV